MNTAELNTEYYLTEKKAVNEPWFRCAKSMETYSEVVLITPEMAQELLEARQTRRYMRVVGTSEFQITGTHYNIAINFSGHLVEGQQILENIIENKKSVEVLITFNLPDKLIF